MENKEPLLLLKINDAFWSLFVLWRRRGEVFDIQFFAVQDHGSIWTIKVAMLFPESIDKLKEFHEDIVSYQEFDVKTFSSFK